MASLELFEQEKTLEKISKIIPFFHHGLERFRELDIVGDVRYIGMVGAVELVRDKRTGKPFKASERLGYRVFKEGLKENLILRPLGDVVYLVPPLCVSRNQLSDILKRTYKVIERCS
ncbi:aminotransferase class III-fold pyridoxal phosphate-dependent enzyme [Planctomycetota bacterium]